jgi:hypothetical protein
MIVGPVSPLPCWISAKRALHPLLSYMDSLKIAATNGGQFPCCICAGLDATPHRVGDWNWCTNCFNKLEECRKCRAKYCGYATTYFTDYDSLVVVLGGESYVETHGCVTCGWRSLELECVKCGKKRCNMGEVLSGAFTCYSCAHPQPPVTSY